MRFPESKIKEAILHPDPEVRDRAASYFARSSPPDPTIMPLVIQALQTHGKKDAYRLVGIAWHLPQSDQTIAWLVDELNDPRTDQYESYAYNLSMVLLHADPALLGSRKSAILDARHFFAEAREPLIERLDMLAWDFATCWRKLEEFCERNKDELDAGKANLDHAQRIVEALARHGTVNAEKVRALLSMKVENFVHNPMTWMEPLAVRLAGQAHLEDTIPLVIAKFLGDGGDMLNEECADALTTIGTPDVLEAVARAYPGAPNHFRRYAIGPLQDIHSDLAVEKCVALLARENDRDLRRDLAHALLGQFAHEGIAAARQLLLGRELDFEDSGLRRYLVTTCTITGERFPEYDEWLATDKAEQAEHRRRVAELKADPEGTMLYLLERMAGEKAPEMPWARRPVLPASRLGLPRKPEARQKVGRNDPCPCGSGKKFKNCCMRK
jgi:hypothetical protein